MERALLLILLAALIPRPAGAESYTSVTNSRRLCGTYDALDAGCTGRVSESGTLWVGAFSDRLPSSDSGSNRLILGAKNDAGIDYSLYERRAAPIDQGAAMVPEAGTLSLLGTGLIGFALLLRRRAKGRKVPVT